MENIYKINDIGQLLSENAYPGRGIIVGTTPDAMHAVFAYFIMGRSSNSRNRVFEEDGEDVIIYPADESLVEDPSLIIYKPVRKIGDDLIVTNGDQTDTVYEFMKEGKSFEEALRTRCFEPDAPNFTPRISALMHFTDGGYAYKMSILKSADEAGSGCNRYFYEYEALCGLGHFIHTYACDGNPIPTFQGEPERVAVDNDIDAFTDRIWNSLNSDNKISLYVRYVSFRDGSAQNRMINKNTRKNA
ncbi:MAG: IMP cyclohydrolase [Eubacteriales bacterium]|nr:IMP cyclohydrolase [Eubacteriales bacterium]